MLFYSIYKVKINSYWPKMRYNNSSWSSSRDVLECFSYIFEFFLQWQRPEGNLHRVWEICEGGKGHHSSNDHTVDSLWKTLFNVCKARNNYISKNSCLFILSRIISVLFQISAEGGCLCIIISSLVWNFHFSW